MSMNTTHTADDRDREMPPHVQDAPDQPASRKQFVPPRLANVGAFTEVTTQFIGSFDP